MNHKSVLNRVEITFWNLLIFGLSQSRALQEALHQAYSTTPIGQRSLLLKRAALWSGIGLLVGFIIGIISV